MERRVFLSVATGLAATAGLATVQQQVEAHGSSSTGASDLSDDDSSRFHPIDRVHQSLIVSGPSGSTSRLPATVVEKIEGLKRLYPSAEYTLWTKDTLRQFIHANEGPEVLEVFDRLIPHTYKNDLGRYCVLYALGGLHSDLGLEHCRPWRIPSQYQFASFQEISPELSGQFALSAGLVWAKPKSPTLRLAIDSIVDACREGFIGVAPGDPTGPGMLGWACATRYLAQWRKGEHRDQYLGVTWFKNHDEGLEMWFVPPEKLGREPPIAKRLPRGTGDNTYLGEGTNNYSELWQRGEVWRPASSISEPPIST